ncbi:MAG: serine hydrolase [Phycisphaerae bacterium]|jgi:CubicO group peptidase (beta-lactamase class C family)
MKTQTRLRAVIASASLLSVLLLCPATLAQGAPTLDQRLERLCRKLESARQEMHIPGMAIAVVKDDHVILARGFGLADLESQRPVTEETLFAVGSTTKAFTATLIGMLVDDGKLGWDDPVAKHLPGYKLKDAKANEQVAVRDLLCHRIGLAAMTLLWFGTGVSREDVLATSLNAELLNPFREKFGYSNESYLAAGLLAARVSGMEWDALLAERIFKPLGMRDSNSTYAAAQRDARMSKGYKWEKEKGVQTHQPMRNIDNIGPAGSINSNVRDMAQWVRFQLGHGSFDGEMLLSREQHEQTWTKHVNVAGNVDYGLGWFLRDWDGKRVVDHAGGIDGFTAEVALLPEENLGFVLLMNLFAAPLQDASRQIVFETLLGEWQPEEAAAASSEDFEPYLGTYVGQFAQFKGVDFTVLVQNGRLAVDVPGQMVYELKPPDDAGKRQFAITDQISVRFNRDEQGKVFSMSIFQAGLVFELPRKGAQYAVEIDLDAARKHLGRFHSEKLDADVTVVIQNNRLAVDVPKQMVYELYPPDKDGRCKFRVKDDIAVRFNADESGATASLTFFQGGEEELLPRVEQPDAPPLPSREELLALVRKGRGGVAADGLRSVRARGAVRFVHMGVEGTLEALEAGPHRSRETIDLGRFGKIVQVCDGERGALDSGATGRLPIEGEHLAAMKLEGSLVWLGDWTKTFDEIDVLRRDTFDGQDVYVVRVKASGQPEATVYVNTATGEVAGRESLMLTLLGPRLPMTHHFADYRDVGGVRWPHRHETFNEITGRMVIEYASVETNVELADAEFRLTAE